jgi:hypothetical protein
MLDSDSDSKKEALRIQAAAVAAQQAALTEEEIRLHQQRLALDQQEAQLSTHLEDKRRRLIEIRDQARQAQAALKEERETFEARVHEMTAHLTETRAEAEACKQEALRERQHILQLRQRLKKRWHRHWTAERIKLRMRESELETARRHLEDQQARVQEDQNALNRARLWFNGEMELGRRRLQEGWDALHQEQQQWQQAREQEQTIQDARDHELTTRTFALHTAARELAEQRRHWEIVREHLEQESEGLEARIANSRRKLLQNENELTRRKLILTTEETITSQVGTTGSIVAAKLARDTLQWRLAALEKLSEELADQRIHLTEQLERLLLVQEDWEQQRQTAMADLERNAALLHQRAEALTLREQELEDATIRCDQRQADIAYVRRYLESWQARLTARAAAWERERECCVADVAARERLADHRLDVLLRIGRLWQQRRREEVEHLQAEYAACAELRLEMDHCRHEWLDRHEALAATQRNLAEKLALLDLAVASEPEALSDDADNVRLKQFQKRLTAIGTAAEKTLAREYHALATEAARVEERFGQVHPYAQKILLLETTLVKEQQERDLIQAQAEEDSGRLRFDLERFQTQQQTYDHQVTELSDEVERLALLLFEYSDTNTQPAVQAA